MIDLIMFIVLQRGLPMIPTHGVENLWWVGTSRMRLMQPSMVSKEADF